MIGLKSILVAVDFEATSEHALVYGRELARKLGATLHVLHVVDDVFALSAGTEGTLAAIPLLQARMEDDARARLGRLLREDDRAAGVEVVTVTSPLPAHAIVTFARDFNIDLIVMGTHNRSGAPVSMMGSVAERVVRTAPCPVLTVRNPESQSVGPEPLATPAARLPDAGQVAP
jgi:nucleotide-binding universal stress UspA family protein